ncbi:MAG: suppressor of fused domain protein [Lentisphaeria bacterium]|nr:suppressor of fused domain protein [Lentisphaeria bacterium]
MYIGVILALTAITGLFWTGLTFHRRRKNRQMIKFVVEIASLPLEEIPDIAAGLAVFLQNIHGIDLKAMSYREQVKYILGNYLLFWHREMRSYIPVSLELKPESQKLPIIASGAYLGELVRQNVRAEWKKDPDILLKAPGLEVEWSGEDLVSYQPFDLLLLASLTGDTAKAEAASLCFESQAVLDEHVRNLRRTNVYTEEEQEQAAGFISRLGTVSQVLNIVNTSEMQVDVYAVEPTWRYPARRLVTCGIGGRAMRIPDGHGSAAPDRVELLLDLPADWPIDGDFWDDPRISWPVSLLKSLAALPWNGGTLIRQGYAVPWPEPFADNTRLSGVLFASPAMEEFETSEVKVSPGKKVHFYQVVPLYPEELDYRLEHGTRKLHELLGEKFSYIVDPQRPNAVTGQ